MTTISRIGLGLSEIVNECLSELVRHQRARDLEGTMGMYLDDAVMFGSASTERAVGRDQIRELYRSFFDLPVTLGWTWSEVIAQGDDTTISFVALGSYDLIGPEPGDVTSGGYRITGVLRRTEEGWRFALFTGAQPTEDDTRNV